MDKHNKTTTSSSKAATKIKKGEISEEFSKKTKKSTIHNGENSTYHGVPAIAIKGHSAILNFPHLAHQLPKPASTSPSDIQAAAIKAAALVINEISPRNHDFNISQAELVPEVGSLGSLDDTFLDLPDLFIDLGHRIDRILYTLPEYIAGIETSDSDLWPGEHFLWNYC
ncbi:DNA-binding domain-containing protein [Artemisia annua]|uniref:DNA-binding domain-containing protein n=1 Tax=Artemisia annua TaxID=35608 RepID=A0A2U1LZ28_ARTAN|nr:DNA-binding domain-containing protein [Artemisia annua]